MIVKDVGGNGKNAQSPTFHFFKAACDKKIVSVDRHRSM
jgi:hypothetical protein